MLTSWSGTRCPSAYTLSPAEPACTCQHKNRRQASCSPVQAYSAAVQSTSSQQPSGAELWEMGIADCEAESCGLIPNGALVLVPADLRAPQRREDRISELEKGVCLDENVATVVGASSANKVNWVLDVPTISGKHARLEAVMDESPPKWNIFAKKQSPVKYYVTDLASTNGTFLNRGRLRPLMPVEIKPGDIIAFGTLKEAYRVVQALADKDFKW